MCRLTLRLIVAGLTFALGIVAASLWLGQRPAVRAPAAAAEQHRQSAPAKQPADRITQDRDLSLYERGGKFGCGGVMHREEVTRCRASIAQARAFILRHWQEKRRAYAIVSFGSVDALSDSHIFIEPDERGGWHVVWRIERVFAVEHSGEIDDVPDIRSVEQRPAGKSDLVPAGTPVLIFKGGDGQVIETL